MEIWNKLLNHMIRASKMDSSLYEEMETDDDALGQAVMIALLASAATGVGMALAGVIGGAGLLWPVWGLFSGFIASLAGWVAWVLITYFLGSTFLKGHEKVSLAELGRTLGFANSPGTLRILAFIPLLGWLVILLTGIWTLASGIVAVRQSLEFPSARAAATCLPGWLLYMAVLLLVYVWLPSPFKMFPG